MVFAKSYCPYCKRTKALLAAWEDTVDINSLDLDLMDQEDGALIQMELLQQTGQRTVPNSEYPEKKCLCIIAGMLFSHYTFQNT